MSLDSLGRLAGTHVRSTAQRDLDVTSSLERLKRSHGRRVAATRAATVVALVGVLTVVGLAVRGARHTAAPPIDRPQPTPTCSAEVCTGTGPFRVDLPARLVWTVPAGFEQHLAGTVVSARPTGTTGRSPIVVLEDVRGGDYRSQAQTPSDASTLAAWMQSTDALHVTGLRRSTLAGVPAVRLVVHPSTGTIALGTARPIPPEDQLDVGWFPRGGVFDVSSYLQRTWAYVPTPGQDTEIWLVDAPGAVTAVVRPVVSDATTAAAQDALLTSMRFVASDGGG